MSTYIALTSAKVVFLRKTRLHHVDPATWVNNCINFEVIQLNRVVNTIDLLKLGPLLNLRAYLFIDLIINVIVAEIKICVLALCWDTYWYNGSFCGWHSIWSSITPYYLIFFGDTSVTASCRDIKRLILLISLIQTTIFFRGPTQNLATLVAIPSLLLKRREWFFFVSELI